MRKALTNYHYAIIGLSLSMCSGRNEPIGLLLYSRFRNIQVIRRQFLRYGISIAVGNYVCRIISVASGVTVLRDLLEKSECGEWRKYSQPAYLTCFALLLCSGVDEVTCTSMLGVFKKPAGLYSQTTGQCPLTIMGWGETGSDTSPKNADLSLSETMA